MAAEDGSWSEICDEIEQFMLEHGGDIEPDIDYVPEEEEEAKEADDSESVDSSSSRDSSRLGYELEHDFDIQRLASVYVTMPADPTALADLVTQARQNDGLPISTCNFLMSVLEHVTLHGDFLFGGTLVCNSWMMGRPAKRLDKLSRAKRSELTETFDREIERQLKPMLASMQQIDPGKAQAWAVFVQVTDPLTQVRDLCETKVNRHMCVLLMNHQGPPELFDPMGRASGMSSITQRVRHAACRLTLYRPEEAIEVVFPVVQAINENTAVLWGVWFVFHRVVGSPMEHITDILKDRVNELGDWCTMLRTHSLVLFVLVFRMFCEPAGEVPGTELVMDRGDAAVMIE